MRGGTSRRRSAHPDIPLGALQLCLPITTTPPQRQSFPLAQEGEEASLATEYSGFACGLTAACHDLEQWAAYTPEHCIKLKQLLHQMLGQVQRHIALLDQPRYRYDQRILSRLRPLHRAIIEALVVVRDVSGVCVRKRHLVEPTGVFWQLVECVHSLRRACQYLSQSCMTMMALARMSVSA